jgi:S-disulfanyl-L-cysteine oxidoreductase SoxD
MRVPPRPRTPLGQPISPADAAQWDIKHRAGRRWPPPAGSGTPAQGAVVYAQQCAACHGEKGKGRTNNRLVGGQITGGGPIVTTVGSYSPSATLFDFTRRAMPWTAPKSLSDNEVYAVTADILRLNGIIGDDDVIDEQDASAGENAQPGRVHSAVPGQALRFKRRPE